MPALSPANVSDPSSSDEILGAFLAYLEESGTTPCAPRKRRFAGNNVIPTTL